MRRALVAAVCLIGACHYHGYDPLDDIDYRVYPSTGAAIAAILEEVARPRVYAVGEYHPTRGSAVRRSPLARFTDEVMELLEPRAQHLVIESWPLDACAGDSAASVGAQVAAAIQRPASTASELARLVAVGQRHRLATHSLAMTCIEQSAMLDARGQVDFLRLLEMITDKLRETTLRLAAEGPGVIVYGGALHNDLYPRYGLAELSYATGVSRELGGGVLEIDLVVPDLVAPLAMIRAEPWYPLLGLASPERVVVWARGPDSYIVMLPAQTEAVGWLARPARTWLR
jgi:hypothetical protein